MKGPDPRRRAGKQPGFLQETRGPLFHLPCGFVGESDGQDIFYGNVPLRNQGGDAMDNDAGFAGTRAR